MMNYFGKTFSLMLFAVLGVGLDGAAGAEGKPVVVAEAGLRQLAPVTWYAATVISREQARLAAEVEGRLLSVADVGTAVRAGEVVARIDDTLLAKELAERRADIAQAQARLGFLEQETRRLQRLARRNNAAQSQLEQVVSDQAVARSGLLAAQARAGQAEEKLKRASLRAPFSGVVRRRLLNAGEWADSGAAVVEMADPRQLEAQCWVSLQALAFVEPGAVVQLDYAGQRAEGVVRTQVPVGDERSRLFELRIRLPAGNWRAGESLRAGIPAAQPRQVLAVPRDALVIRRHAIFVYRVNGEGIAERVSVRPGIASGDYIEVVGALNQGDRVVVRGGERLRDGQAVAVQAAGSDS